MSPRSFPTEPPDPAAWAEPVRAATSQESPGRGGDGSPAGGSVWGAQPRRSPTAARDPDPTRERPALRAVCTGRVQTWPAAPGPGILAAPSAPGKPIPTAARPSHLLLLSLTGATREAFRQNAGSTDYEKGRGWTRTRSLRMGVRGAPPARAPPPDKRK